MFFNGESNPNAPMVGYAVLDLSDKIPDFTLRNVIEVLALRDGDKPSVRLTVARRDIEYVQQVMVSLDLVTVVSDWILETSFSTSLGDRYVSVRRVSQSKPDDQHVVAVARTSALARDLLDAEESGNNREISRLLGYPKCCCTSYEAICPQRDWLYSILENTLELDSYPCGANRIEYLFSDASLFYDYFPCDLTCVSTREISRMTYQRLVRYGFGVIAERLAEHMSRPLFVFSNGIVQLLGASRTKGGKEISVSGFSVYARAPDFNLPAFDRIRVGDGEYIFTIGGTPVRRVPAGATDNRLLWFGDCL